MSVSGDFKGPQARSSLRFHLQWPDDAPSNACDNFFLGLWHPHQPVHVEWKQSSVKPCLYRQGRNWFLASAASPFHQPTTGLVHSAPESSFAVGFRGYVLPCLHSYSPSSDIREYWHSRVFDEHNGVFSAAIVSPSGDTLTLITDALGIGSLYYRTCGNAVLFSTNPRYLSMPHDRPDLLAWRSLIQTSWILGDRTLSLDIKRVPAGKTVCFSPEGERSVAWFSFDQLPDGTIPAGRTAIGDVEDAFQQAMARCLALQIDSRVLPLSSGFDSRRILTGLMKHNADFQALTCRVFQKEYRDLDATFAHAMAQEFGFTHTIVEAKNIEEYVLDDHARRRLVNGETGEHTWAVRLMATLPNRPSMLFDGIGGDILGDPVGWNVHIGLQIAPSSPEEDIEGIAQASVTNIFDSTLRRNHWPAIEDLREDLTSYLRQYIPRRNIGELAFLLLRQRRTIALWSQQLLPPGHLAVCPFFDLDYLRLLLTFTSVDKHAIKFQRACLRAFWPQFYQYPGNRDIPPTLPPGSPQLHQHRTLRCSRAMIEDMVPHGGVQFLHTLLAPKGRLLFECSSRNQSMAIRNSWRFHGLTELVWRETLHKPCWEIRET